jgi:hypothetical protein
MKLTKEQVFEAALALPYEDRELLMEVVYSSLHPPPDWLKAEVRRRSEELLSGKVKGVPWGIVKREAQELLDE